MHVCLYVFRFVEVTPIRQVFSRPVPQVLAFTEPIISSMFLLTTVIDVLSARLLPMPHTASRKCRLTGHTCNSLVMSTLLAVC